LNIMSFASMRKMPKSFRDNIGGGTTTNGIPNSIQKTVRRRDQRGNSLIHKTKEINNNIINPYTSTAKSKSSSKMLFASKAHGSSSLVRPKRIVYPGGGESELAPLNHDAAKLKLETIFNNKGVKKRDPLQLLTKPKKKLNLLKKLPNDKKYNPRQKDVKNPFLLKSEVKLNRTGMNQMQMNKIDSSIGDFRERITTTQTQMEEGSRASTKHGKRTRTQIIAEFFCSQNWNYMAKKVIMVKNEREQTRVCISKYRNFKNGLRKFWKVYKVWITKIKAQRQGVKDQKLSLAREEQKLQQFEEEKQLKVEEEKQLKVEEEKRKYEEVKQRKAKADEVWDIQEVKKCEFILNEDDDIFSLNEGVDLSKFKENEDVNTDEYADKINMIKQDKKKIKNEIKHKKLDEIVEEEEESVMFSPFIMKVGKVLALKLEKAWKRKMERREGKKLRDLLKNLPPQCRTSYVKLMQLRKDTADLESDMTKMPARFF